MCGRYIPNTEDEIAEVREILKRISIKIAGLALAEPKTDDVRPSQDAAVIRQDGDTLSLSFGRWGFTRWDGKGLIINARHETAHSSRTFAPYYERGRCAVPAHGYYEWKKVGKSSYKYAFTGGECGIFMAGFIRPGAGIPEYVIITKDAQPEFFEIHDRMPLLIPPELLGEWLSGGIGVFELATITAQLCAEAVK